MLLYLFIDHCEILNGPVEKGVGKISLLVAYFVLFQYLVREFGYIFISEVIGI